MQSDTMWHDKFGKSIDAQILMRLFQVLSSKTQRTENKIEVRRRRVARLCACIDSRSLVLLGHIIFSTI